MDKLTWKKTAFGKMNGMCGMYFMTVAAFINFGFIQIISECSQWWHYASSHLEISEF